MSSLGFHFGSAATDQTSTVTKVKVAKKSQTTPQQQQQKTVEIDSELDGLFKKSVAFVPPKVLLSFFSFFFLSSFLLLFFFLFFLLSFLFLLPFFSFLLSSSFTYSFLIFLFVFAGHRSGRGAQEAECT